MSCINTRRQTAKLPVNPDRIRRMPTQFAPLDRRLVYDRHILLLTHQQSTFYMFLHCVADAAGLSYYSDERICEYLNFTLPELRDARQGLIQRQFILYCKPIYQLLDLPHSTSSPSAAKASCSRVQTANSQGTAASIPIATVLNELCAKEFAV